MLFALVATVVLFVAQQSDATSAIFGGNQTALDRFNELREAYSDAGSVVRTNLVDTSTPLGLLLWLPIGLAYFFFAPLPFSGSSAISLAATPEMLVWYWLLPSAARGFRIARRNNQLRALSPLLLYAMVSAIGWSIVITNVGSMFRYRGQILFFAIILIAIDQVTRREQRERRQAVELERLAQVAK